MLFPSKIPTFSISYRIHLTSTSSSCLFHMNQTIFALTSKHSNNYLPTRGILSSSSNTDSTLLPISLNFTCLRTSPSSLKEVLPEQFKSNDLSLLWIPREHLNANTSPSYSLIKYLLTTYKISSFTAPKLLFTLFKCLCFVSMIRLSDSNHSVYHKARYIHPSIHPPTE